ncbi:MAG: radical SAM family heme chaperone HemW [Rhodospirillaceae bacterium]|jgi:putative oxygen-independent coproporphyrinogen III oxidase
MSELALYVHWPFCESKCPYCDFNSHVTESIDQTRWAAAFCAELDHFASEINKASITSVFFGGGTPSLMTPPTVAAVLKKIDNLWGLPGEAEITLEANPSSVEANRFADYHTAGVNRVSLGVQSLDESVLKFLGRRHSRDEALAAIGIAAKTFSRFSFDLIYARPGQTIASWRNELQQALSLAGSHISVYQLTIEPGTAFHKDRVSTVDEETGAALYEMTQEMLEQADMPAYEISNHARPGDECRHNLTYWRMGSWLGIGPGAHSRLQSNKATQAFHHWRAPDKWLEAVESLGHGTAKRMTLTVEDDRTETILMGLRLREGINRKRFESRFGSKLETTFDSHALSSLIEEDYLVCDKRALKATAKGRQCLNAVLEKLLA